MREFFLPSDLGGGVHDGWSWVAWNMREACIWHWDIKVRISVLRLPVVLGKGDEER